MNKSKKPCSFFRKGQCERGFGCPFSHDTPRVYSAKARVKRPAAVCKFFQSGHCRSGDSCRFAHPAVSAAVSAAASPSASEGKHEGKQSSEICVYFRKGGCNQGASCRFSHDLSTEPCYYFHDYRLFDGPKDCKKGNSCPFGHERISIADFVQFFKKQRRNEKKTDSPEALLSPRTQAVDNRLLSLEKRLVEVEKEKEEAEKKHEDLLEKMKTIDLNSQQQAKENISIDWQWTDDLGGWESYGQIEQDLFEGEYQKDKLSSFHFTMAETSFTYEADFESMTQRNLKTSKTRKIRRKCTNNAEIDKELQASLDKWNIATADSVKRFVRSAHVDKPMYHVSSVLRILRQDVLYESPKHASFEKLLFHATSPDACLAIQNGSFIPSQGGMLGAGIYFAPSPEKAWGYKKGSIPSMLLCLVNTESAKTRGAGAMKEYCVSSSTYCKPLYILVFRS